jgi:DNA helicase-2/ATP-dependent DNA helicase PcrA
VPNSLLNDLNPEQQEAVLHLDGPLLIVAGAGSGKTRVIVHRIAHIIASGAARPEQVLAVTFTNKAAEEMRGRVERLLGAACEGIWLSTFHAFCARVLRREAPAIGLSRDFVIYDSADQLAAVKQVMKTLRIDDGVLQPRAVLGRISHAKNRMEPPETAFGQSFQPGIEDLRRIYAAYQAALAEASAVDFDDLLLRTVALFDQPEVAARYASRFRHVMVDEYQDTNRPQYLLMRRLAAVHHNICVVGDPDQSIYKWRGADLRNILDFEKDFADAEVVRLERNYRSTAVILGAASAVIAHNVDRKPKRLWTDRAGGSRIVCFRGNDELEEADFISRTARRALRDAEKVVGVLYRTNAQSRVIEDALRRAGVAYRIVGGVRFYERREIKDALAYLKLMLNPHDDVSLRRVINVPARGVGKGVMDALEQVPIEQPRLGAADERPAPASLWARLERGLDERRFAPRPAASLSAFRDLVVRLTEMAHGESVSVAIGRMLDQTGYLEELRSERTEDAEGRAENLAELVSAAREFEAREPSPALAGFVDRLSLLSDADEEAGSQDARVLMMTLHSAKGLEFPVVIMSGLEEGLFPHALASEDAADLEEERRLCYVGMTRARQELLLTSAARRRVFGEYRSTRPSRFIDEVPQELLDVELPAGARSFSPACDRSLSFAEPRYGRHGRSSRVREAAEPRYEYENEDQTSVPLGPGLRVRHPQFGVGTVISVEQLDDDVKVTVRFPDIGQKKLLARYAKLERA